MSDLLRFRPIIRPPGPAIKRPGASGRAQPEAVEFGCMQPQIFLDRGRNVF
jgi:hypothetical protein